MKKTECGDNPAIKVVQLHISVIRAQLFVRYATNKKNTIFLLILVMKMHESICWFCCSTWWKSTLLFHDGLLTWLVVTKIFYFFLVCTPKGTNSIDNKYSNRCGQRDIIGVLTTWNSTKLKPTDIHCHSLPLRCVSLQCICILTSIYLLYSIVHHADVFKEH